MQHLVQGCLASTSLCMLFVDACVVPAGMCVLPV